MKKKIVIIGMVLCSVSFFWGSKTVNAKSTYVSVNATNFPDAKVRQAIHKDVDFNMDGKLSKREIEECTGLFLYGTKTTPIKSLKGIQIFKNVTRVSLQNVVSVDDAQLKCLSKLKKMEIATCGKTIDLSHLSLKSLRINDEEDLDYFEQEDEDKKDFIYTWSAETGGKLEELKCPQNLEFLELRARRITTLNIKGISNLNHIVVGCPLLYKIETDKENKITKAEISAGQLTELNLGNLNSLTSLYIAASSSYQYDFSNNSELVNLKIDSCNNPVVNLANNKKLEGINLNGNFQKLVLAKNETAKPKLDCYLMGKNFSECNFGEAKNIDSIWLDGSKYSCFDVSQNRNICSVYLRNANTVQSVVLPKNSSKEPELYLEFEKCKKLNQVNFNDARNISTLRFQGTSFTKLDVSKLTRLTWLECYYNTNLKSITLPKVSSKAKGMRLELEGDRNLSSCNINDARNITKLEIIRTGFTKLNLSKITRLYDGQAFIVNYNAKLKQISMPKTSSKAKEIWCDLYCNKKLEKADFNSTKNITQLNVDNTNFKTLMLTKLKKLDTLYCMGNKRLKKIYIRKGKKLEIYKSKKVKVIKTK